MYVSLSLDVYIKHLFTNHLSYWGPAHGDCLFKPVPWFRLWFVNISDEGSWTEKITQNDAQTFYLYSEERRPYVR